MRRVGLAKKAAEASARRLAARDAEGLLPSPRRTKRKKSVTPSQLMAESQSLLSSPESTGTPLTSAVEVNVESQLTHGTNFPSDRSSVSSVSVTAADGATLVAAAADLVTNPATSTVAAIADPPAVADVAAAEEATPPTPVTLQDILTDTKYHVDRERWFELLQDSGTAMNAEEKDRYGTPQKGKRAKRHYNISFKKVFYPDLYQLASLVIDKMKQFPGAFPRLKHSPKNVSNYIHPIGLKIAEMRKRYP